MRTLVASLLTAACFNLVTFSSAIAADPACARSTSPATCNCAAENGGLVRVVNGTTNVVPPATTSPSHKGFITCLEKSKRNRVR